MSNLIVKHTGLNDPVLEEQSRRSEIDVKLEMQMMIITRYLNDSMVPDLPEHTQIQRSMRDDSQNYMILH